MRPLTTAESTSSLLHETHRTRKGRSGVGRVAGLLSAFAVALLATTPAHAAQMQVLNGHVPRAAVANSRVTGRLAETTQLKLAIGLPLRNSAELDSLLAEMNDPTSSKYHQYLTPEQFAAQFGPTEADYIALIGFARENGLTVTATHPNRMLLDVAGSTATVEKALHVNMVTYLHPVRGAFYAPDREPSLDTEVATLDISGLENYDVPQPMGLQRVPMTAGETPYVTGSGPGGYFIGKDFRAAYASGVTLTGTNQVVGLLEFDGFYAADVQKNFAAANQTPVPVQTVLLDGVSGAAGSDNTEVTLDIMMAAYMAPGLSKVIVYEGTTPNDILNRMATDNLAQQISSSWGYNPVNATTEQIFKEYIAQGQSVLQASGDSGAYKNGVMPPSDDPNLTVVGGTDLTTNGADGPWQAETAWSGSGGGVSTGYAIPSYQAGVSMASNGGSKTMRNIPDLGMLANPSIYLIQNNGQAIIVGGTSAAAPLWGGFVALANQQAAANSKARVGFLNPLVYAIGESSNYSADFNDIRSGNDSGFNAVTGYDLTTGWGSPAGQHLINDLTATATAAPTASFTLSSSPAALTVKQAGSGSSTITVAPQNGFSGTVSLALSGLPSGVTAVLSATSTKTTATLTFTANATATVGTYPVKITGTSGTLSSTTTITLTVVAPGFTLATSPASLTVPRSSSASNTITVTGVNGFSGSVALTVGTLPSGLTASFSPATTTTSSKLTFAASSTAAAGTYSVTVTGTSGTLKATTTVSVTVTAPGFTLAFVPTSLGVTRGSSASGTLSLAAVNGFAGTVSVSVTGLPAGVTASFGTAITTGTSINFAASSTATIGNSTVTLKGTSGTLSASTAFTLTVAAPASGSTTVSLAPYYNVNALVTDGHTFTGGGLDGGLNGSVTAYSENLTGMQQTIAGTLFVFGPANALDSVSAKTITLPAGQYAAIRLLATGVNGAQAAQLFKVTYTDGSSTTMTQSLSDWFTPQNFAGESKAITMAYRDNGAGQRDNRTFYLYEYAFALNPAKTVASITTPNSRNVVLLAATLTH
jgi:subtilase family serine protease